MSDDFACLFERLDECLEGANLRFLPQAVACFCDWAYPVILAMPPSARESPAIADWVPSAVAALRRSMPRGARLNQEISLLLRIPLRPVLLRVIAETENDPVQVRALPPLVLLPTH